MEGEDKVTTLLHGGPKRKVDTNLVTYELTFKVNYITFKKIYICKV